MYWTFWAAGIEESRAECLHAAFSVVRVATVFCCILQLLCSKHSLAQPDQLLMGISLGPLGLFSSAGSFLHLQTKQKVCNTAALG